MSNKEEFSFVLNKIEYLISIKTEEDNIIIESKQKEGDVPFYYKFSSNFETLKKEYVVFQSFDLLAQAKQFLLGIAEKKENIELEFESEKTMKITFIHEFPGKIIQYLKFNLQRKITSETKMIEYLENKNDLLIKEIKDIIKSNNLSFEESKINIMSSLIKNDKEFNLIKSGIKDLNNKKVKLKLLYKASEDGDSPEIFHSKCDKKGPTITIFKTKKNYTFGGYTDKSWDSSSKNSGGNNIFLFSLNNKKIYPGANGGSIFCHENVGPRFSYALGANYNFLNEEQNNQTEYQNMKKKWENFEKEYELTGEKTYYLTEIEVFHLEFKN
jgi:hypothetical protein